MTPTTNDSVFSYNIPTEENQHPNIKEGYSGSLQQSRYLDFGNLNSTTIQEMPSDTHSISNDEESVTERNKKRKATETDNKDGGNEHGKKKFKFIDASSSFYPTQDVPPQLPRMQSLQSPVDNSPPGYGHVYPSFFLPPPSLYGTTPDRYNTGVFPFNPYSNRPNINENEYNRFNNRNLIQRGESATEAFRKSMTDSRPIRENNNVQPVRTNRIQIATEIVHQDHLRSPMRRGVVVSTENNFQIHGVFNQVNVFIETSNNRISTRVEAVMANPNRHSIALNISNYLTVRGPMMNPRFLERRLRAENNGLSRESLDNLTTFKYDKQPNLDSCSICLESFKKGEDVTSLPCAHGYHKDCIYEWMSRKNACPMCRSSV